ncbi:hypothetical protein [Pediococcus pentosaceus]|uniref:hypothetical protein n=1 Tax=Pediococcus pentosaceus TaxID=1255 RepID=UPI003982A4B0
MNYKNKEEINKIVTWARVTFPNSALPIDHVKVSIKYIILCIDILDFLKRISDEAALEKILVEVRTVYMWLLYYILNYSDVAYESAVRSTSEWTMRLCIKYIDTQITFSELSQLNHARMWPKLNESSYFTDKKLLNNINNIFANSSKNIHRDQFSNPIVVDFLNDITKTKDNKAISKINKDVKFFYKFILTEVWDKEVLRDNLTVSQKMKYKEIQECR